jgi:pantoate--beta-alanine ligase
MRDADGRALTLVHSRDALDAALTEVPPVKRFVVMTMGALHAGHAALIKQARADAGDSGTVIVTVYVNALQFNDDADLSRYPRTLQADVSIADLAGADIVWAPTAVDVFRQSPEEFDTDPGALGEMYEGAQRPGHFRGMLTVVRAFLTALQPVAAYFGEKDYQQLALIKQMVQRLAIDTQVIAVPTVREADGLALSSRNVFLTSQQRQQALGISRALFAGQACASRGRSAVFEAADAILRAYMLEPDYRALVGEDFAHDASGKARMLIAVKVGDVRLIDNIAIDFTGTQTAVPQSAAANVSIEPGASSA